MEINPYKFLYRSYEELAAVSRVLNLPSRLNSIAVGGAKVSRFLREFANFTDDNCQAHNRCRSLSRLSRPPTRCSIARQSTAPTPSSPSRCVRPRATNPRANRVMVTRVTA